MRTRDVAAKRFEGSQGIQKSREAILQGSVGKENLRAQISRYLREELLLLSLHVTPISLSSPSPPLHHHPPSSHCLQAVKQTQKAWDELSGMERGTPRVHPDSWGTCKPPLVQSKDSGWTLALLSALLPAAARGQIFPSPKDP